MMTPRPTTQDIEIGRKIFRNWCRDNNLAVDPVAASDLVQKIAETIAVMCAALTNGGETPCDDLTHI
jgi:hypothetical protein